MVLLCLFDFLPPSVCRIHQNEKKAFFVPGEEGIRRERGERNAAETVHLRGSCCETLVVAAEAAAAAAAAVAAYWNSDSLSGDVSVGVNRRSM